MLFTFLSAQKRRYIRKNCVILLIIMILSEFSRFLQEYYEENSPNSAKERKTPVFLLFFWVKNKLETPATTNIDKILQKGEESDTGKRIAVALTAIQKLGIEVPAPIFNFSQCQLRLQAAVDSLNEALKQIKDKMLEIKAAMAMSKAAKDFSGRLVRKVPAPFRNTIRGVSSVAGKGLRYAIPGAAKLYAKGALGLARFSFVNAGCR